MRHVRQRKGAAPRSRRPLLFGQIALARGYSPLVDVIITNGVNLVDTTGWSAIDSSLSAVAGKLRVTSDLNLFGIGYQAFTTVNDKSYVASVDYTKETATGAVLRVATTSNGNDLLSIGVSSSQVISGVFVADGTTTYIALWNNDNVGTDYSDFGDITVVAVPD